MSLVKICHIIAEIVQFLMMTFTKNSWNDICCVLSAANNSNIVTEIVLKFVQAEI